MKRRLCSAVVFAACVVPTMSSLAQDAPPAPAGPYLLDKPIPVGGDGGWDYVKLDDAGKRLFVTRGTHTMVIDTMTGTTLADIPGMKRAHGTALVPAVNRGFISDGRAGTVTVFDLTTYAVLGTVKADEDADGIIYDAGTNRVWVGCGDAGTLVGIKPDINLKEGAEANVKIDLGGKPEYIAADGAGMIYVNIEDKSELVAIDGKAGKLTARWPLAPGDSPSGLAIDAAGGHLFSGCHNQKMIVLDTKTGKVLANLPIGTGVDATAFDHGYAMASCGDGTLTIARETSPGQFAVVQTLQTARGARTMTIDANTGAVYLPTADLEPLPANAPPRTRPKPVAGTFKIEVAKLQAAGRN